ncbi:3144_t:CDS:2 [Scutellospora calospora]|uniref:3144_t:CDS:1 n=1 Tax=Scutellospora calospora TaxID=85575 RepID=A0ACA9N6R0_9GLOM|nr:3144_t:CDS:2 [Scutellospora calospora]
MDTDDLFENIPDNSMAECVATTSNSANIISDILIVSKRPSTKLLSPVRPYFSQKTIDNQSVICSICKSEFSVTIATSNLHKHLNSRHLSWETNKSIPIQQVLTFTPEATISKQTLIMAQKTKFNIIDLPSHDVIKSIIQKAFTVMQKDIQSLFEQISSKISITLDIWTSRANMPFICITAYWIDSD